MYAIWILIAVTISHALEVNCDQVFENSPPANFFYVRDLRANRRSKRATTDLVPTNNKTTGEVQENVTFEATADLGKESRDKKFDGNGSTNLNEPQDDDKGKKAVHTVKSHLMIWAGPVSILLVTISVAVICLGPCSPLAKIPKNDIIMKEINTKKFNKSKLQVEISGREILVKVSNGNFTGEEKQKVALPIPQGIKPSECFASISDSGMLKVIMLKNYTQLEKVPLKWPKPMEIGTPVNAVHVAGFSPGRSKSMEVLCENKPFGDVTNKGYFTMDLKRVTFNVEMGMPEDTFAQTLPPPRVDYHNEDNDINEAKIPSNSREYQTLDNHQYMSIGSPFNSMKKKSKKKRSSRQPVKPPELPSMLTRPASLPSLLDETPKSKSRKASLKDEIAGNKAPNEGMKNGTDDSDEYLASLPPPPAFLLDDDHALPHSSSNFNDGQQQSPNHSSFQPGAQTSQNNNPATSFPNPASPQVMQNEINMIPAFPHPNVNRQYSAPVSVNTQLGKPSKKQHSSSVIDFNEYATPSEEPVIHFPPPPKEPVRSLSWKPTPQYQNQFPY